MKSRSRVNYRTRLMTNDYIHCQSNLNEKDEEMCFNYTGSVLSKNTKALIYVFLFFI